MCYPETTVENQKEPGGLFLAQQSLQKRGAGVPALATGSDLQGEGQEK